MNFPRAGRIVPVCLLLFSFIFAAANAEAVNVNRKVMPNGLTVLHSENHNLPIVMVTLIVKASQLNEPAEKAGLAYLTAELLTEGTKSRSSREISEAEDFIGASLGASAGKDYTTVGLAVLKKDIYTGFDLFADVLLNPVFPSGEIARTKERLKGFLKRQEEEPSFLAARAFMKEVFGPHPYGRLVEGSTETIDSILREDLIRFHKEYFLPNNSILSVSGDLTPDELEALIARYLGDWKKEDTLAKQTAATELPDKKKVLTINRDLTQATILFGHKGVSRENPDYYAISVLNYILGGGGFSSRLMQSVREQMGLVYDIHSFFAPHKQSGTFELSLQTSNETANTALDEIFKQLERIRKEEVSDQELSDAKSYLTGSFPRRLDTNRKLADFLATVEFYNLGLDYANKYPQYINSVTKEDVLRVARKYLYTDNYILVVVADLKKALLKYK